MWLVYMQLDQYHVAVVKAGLAGDQSLLTGEHLSGVHQKPQEGGVRKTGTDDPTSTRSSRGCMAVLIFQNRTDIRRACTSEMGLCV